MLTDVARHPWRIWQHAALLARLHDQLHAISGPDWLAQPFGAGTQLLHRDLHPDNVMLTPGGAMVIDWSGACRGPAGVDIARSWLLMATSEVPGSPAQRLVAKLGRNTFLKAFLRGVDHDAACAALPAVAAQRLEDKTITSGERELIQNFAPRRCANRSPLQSGGMP
jgi:Ser/Thr protein kinase RdoA (MazF antagonist)